MSKAPYYLVVSARNEGRADSLRDCVSQDLEGAQQEAIAEFRRLWREDNDIMVRVVDSTTRIVERAINKDNVNSLDHLPVQEDEQPYTPTAADEAIQASLITGMVLNKIQQLYVAGKYTLATYNELYDVARRANVQVRVLLEKLEAKQ